MHTWSWSHSVPASLPLLLCVVLGGCEDTSSGGPDADTQADAARDADLRDEGGDADSPSRWIELDGAINTRDLGGYTAGQSATAWRKLIRSGHLSDLSQRGCQSFADLGVKTVVDLRMASEASSSPPPSCVTDHAQVVSVQMTKILPPSADNYLALMSQSDEAVVDLFETLADAEAYPILYHCIIGRDRVNFATAVAMAAAGADRATILEEYRLGAGVEDEWIEAVLDEIDTRGGIDAYLSDVGVAPAHVDALKTHLLE